MTQRKFSPDGELPQFDPAEPFSSDTSLSLGVMTSYFWQTLDFMTTQ